MDKETIVKICAEMLDDVAARATEHDIARYSNEEYVEGYEQGSRDTLVDLLNSLDAMDEVSVDAQYLDLGKVMHVLVKERVVSQDVANAMWESDLFANVLTDSDYAPTRMLRSLTQLAGFNISLDEYPTHNSMKTLYTVTRIKTT